MAPERPKLKKLRLALVLSGLAILALISTIFGMMMAVAGDVDDLTAQAELLRSQGRNSTLVTDEARLAGGQRVRIAKLTGNENRILVEDAEISPNVKNAVIAVEDKRFYEHEGVDYRGITRALWQDVRQQRAVQGGSTITQQFAKNALAAQGDRSVFQKLRESAVAYHLERKWSKQKILTQYLNTVYFGSGAYGIESAARTYFGKGDPRFDRDARKAALAAGGSVDTNARAASTLGPHEAALLAGIIASPSAYDPIQNPVAARKRRNLVLQRMLEQGMLTRPEYDAAVVQAMPTEDELNPPQPDSEQPYFSSWVTQQLVDRYRAGRVFGGGLTITTTLDPELQAAAESAVRRIDGIGPSASLVAIENRTGEVKALVGGNDFKNRPFNLATNGHRQPGSAFKPFTLLEALRSGIGPGATFASHQKTFTVPRTRGREKFVVSNYEDRYAGITTLASATITSDNSVFAELGINLGTRKIARLAERMGIRTKISTNYAMTLGGLEEGVTPLEMAYAYSTIANGGLRVSGDLASWGPVAVEEVSAGSRTIDRNDRRTKRIFSQTVADQARQMLNAVVLRGTGRAAQIGEFAAGKTGTTENYGDAWFVGFNHEYTVAVWVGYADRLRSMQTEYGGKPVAGGTFPAEIWRTFMLGAIRVRDARLERAEAAKAKREGKKAPLVPAPAAPAAPQATSPEEKPEKAERARPKERGERPRREVPAPEPPREPAPPEPPAQPPVSPGGGAAPGEDTEAPVMR